ncbi:bifunctional acetate--CoA ligase family protein/GNAT family N-acetyltransferase [Candidimonas nitroreducens]|uniref:GNAT family N-acetyltransferase n=1 Tax=Candidimonas nitroreducens TaxID=683354 RepID=A0A225MH50_9BURK|nr:GNAT family N-acetyltransferase [Candidimonas nitroreducens]OWT58259.1 GNAT family N-acetyltransferase [Candidimonas nitroreducens]
MLRHRLAALFEPQSLLVLSDRHLPMEGAESAAQPGAPGGRPAAGLWDGRSSFVMAPAEGPIVLSEADMAFAWGGRADLALVCVAPARLPEALQAVRAVRPHCVILLSQEQSSADRMQDMAYCRAWGRINDCLVLGPNSFGVQRPHLGLNLTHQAAPARAGRVALVTQSRSITAAVLDWAEDVNLGFSAVVSVGDEAVVDIPQVLEYLSMDTHTDSIALYVEDVATARAFASALRAAASVKPVVVLRAGRAADPQHDAVFNALLRRGGAVRVSYFVQLFSALKVLGYARRPRGRRIALLANGSGAPLLALDVMGPAAAVLRAEFSQTTLKALRDLLEPGAEVRNPVVTHDCLDPARVARILGLLVDDPGVDGVLVLLAPDPLSDVAAVARQLAALAPQARKPIITCFMGDASMRSLRHLLDDVGTPAFRTPETAAHAFGILAAHHYNQVLAQQILPPEPLERPPRVDEARAILRAARAAGRTQLSAAECQQVLDCFFIPIHCSGQAGDPALAAEVGAPMAVRVKRDAQIGPYVQFGAGDGSLDRSHDRAIELPPFNSFLARQLVERSALWRRVLSRQMSPAAFERLREALEHISTLVTLLDDVETLCIEPLYAGSTHLEAGAIALQLTARAEPQLPEQSGYRHMAIHPYPARLVQYREFADGQPWTLRPIRPEDAEPLQNFVRGLSDESRYMRFVSMLRELTPRMLERYTRIDYDKELALVATVQVPNPQHRGHPREEIIGFAHYLRNADGRGAEYALVIADAWQRRGLGMSLMQTLIEAARSQGLTYIDGLVLASNHAMLSLMTRLGLRNDGDPEDPTMRRVWLDLGEGAQ